MSVNTSPKWLHQKYKRPFTATRVLSVSAIILFITFTLLSGTQNKTSTEMDMPIKTAGGMVQGLKSEKHNVISFKGIPYAASTAGENRWRSPQPREPWEGVYTADNYGDACMQSRPPQGLNMSEDCLSLNIWSPAASPKDKLPVYIWIFGGRFVFGSGAEPAYNGENLASKGVVVVTINYRLGIFGWLATPQLSKESGHGSGNYGLLDQIAALKWVQENIAAFGGDPEQVTIGGQSAGAASVLHLIDSPLAKGLFQGAIAESAALYSRDQRLSGLAASYRLLEVAEQQGEKTTAEHNVSSIAEMRTLPAEDLLKGNNANDPMRGSPPLFRPVLDGWVMPQTYEEAMASGLQNDVSVVAGNNHDEGAVAGLQIKLEDYLQVSKEKYGSLADEFLALYPAQSDKEAANATNLAIRESTRVSTWLWSVKRAQHSKNPTFTYWWTQAPPSGVGMGKMTGAFHGSEMRYVFDNLDLESNAAWTSDDREIAGKMSTYWANFIKRRDPNDGELPTWAVSSKDSTQAMLLGKEMHSIDIAAQDKIEFWSKFFDSQEKGW